MTETAGRPTAKINKKPGKPAGLQPQPDVAFLGMPTFTKAAKIALGDDQLRRNLAHATRIIRT